MRGLIDYTWVYEGFKLLPLAQTIRHTTAEKDFVYYYLLIKIFKLMFGTIHPYSIRVHMVLGLGL